jgi:hypothetical protein
VPSSLVKVVLPKLTEPSSSSCFSPILVFDENNDGQITSSSEIAFAKLTDTNDTDLEALKTKFDSNDDNILSSDDAKF